MSKRRIEEIKAELKEAKRLEQDNAYKLSAMSTLDPIFQKMGEKLEPYRTRKEGAWVLKLYPPAGAEWRDQSRYQMYIGFGMNQPWSMRKYYESRTSVWASWLEFRADTREELIPDNADLLRLFGVLFFVHETSLKWTPVEPAGSNVADCLQPLNANIFRSDRVPHDLTDPATVSRLVSAMLFEEELPRTVAQDKASRLRAEKAEIEAKLASLDALALAVHEQVYPYSHVNPLT